MSKFLDNFEDFSIEIHGVRCPKVEISKQKKDELGLPDNCDNLSIIKSLVNYGFKKKLTELKATGASLSEYKDRCIREIEVMHKLDLIDYMLLVWDIFEFCEKNKIATGCARGSSGGSCVLYFLGVTKIDPIKYNLYFERFLSETRANKKVVDGITYLDGGSMADIDSDICYYRRNEVISYLKEKFKGKTARISNETCLTGKILMKDCAKTIALVSEEEACFISGQLESKFGKIQDIEDAYENNPVFKEWCDLTEHKDVYEIAKGLKGLIRGKSVHASGQIISVEPLSDICPVNISEDGEEVSAFSMGYATKMCLKVDLLGLKSVSVIQDICGQLGIDYLSIDPEDYSNIYQHLDDLKLPYGLFQIEAPTNYRVLRDVKPRDLNQLAAVTSLARPGALAFVEQYAKFVKDGTIQSLDPLLDEVLKDTGSTIIYQEQLMAIGNQVFKLDLAQTNELRRTVSKKKPDKMAQFEAIIYDNAKRFGISEETAKKYWDVCLASADYSFCRCLDLNTTVQGKSAAKLITHVEIGDSILAYDTETRADHLVEVLDIFHNNKELFEFIFDNGRRITCSLDHKFLTSNGMKTIREIFNNGLEIVCA